MLVLQGRFELVCDDRKIVGKDREAVGPLGAKIARREEFFDLHVRVDDWFLLSRHAERSCPRRCRSSPVDTAQSRHGTPLAGASLRTCRREQVVYERIAAAVSAGGEVSAA